MSFIKGDIGESLWCIYFESKGYYNIIIVFKKKFYDWDVKSEYDFC